MRPRLLFTGLLWCGIVALVGCGSSLQPSGHGGGGVPSGGGGAAGARATGGVPGAGAGGLPGAGGGYGAGGLPGAGGMRGTAAVSGQAGGTPGSGGLFGSGGAPGAGGVRGTGGAAPVACGNTICTADEFCCDPLCSTCAPAGGLCALGCPVDGGSTGACASLEAQYDQALAAARACTPGASGACATMLPAALRGSECGCNLVYVNDGAQASAIYQSWRSLGCERLVLCLDCGDPPRRSGACVASDGGTGACQFVPLAGG